VGFVIFGVGALVAATAPSTGVLVAARFVLGIAVGCAALTVPLYLSEIAPAEARGSVTSLNQMMVVIGILVAYIVDAVLAPAEAWRWMLGLAVVPSIVLFAGMLVMPETPRFLVQKGREDAARRVLARTFDDDDDESETSASWSFGANNPKSSLGASAGPSSNPSYFNPTDGYEGIEGMRRTASGMLMPIDEDEDDLVAAGLFGRVSETVNTVKDIGWVLWNSFSSRRDS